MKLMVHLWLVAILSVSAFAQEEEPKFEDLSEEEQAQVQAAIGEALKEAESAPILLAQKSIGGLGEREDHTNPASMCVLMDTKHVMANISTDEEGYEKTQSRIKDVKWAELNDIKDNIEKAAKEELKTVAVHKKLAEPTVTYRVIVYQKFKAKVGDKEFEMAKPEEVILYQLAEKEQKREGEATDWLIEYIDEKCPNEKPYEELVASSERELEVPVEEEKE